MASGGGIGVLGKLSSHGRAICGRVFGLGGGSFGGGLISMLVVGLG